MNTFSIKEAVKFGWDTVFKNFWFLLGVFLVTNAVPQIITSGGQQMSDAGVEIFGGLIVIAGTLFSLLLTFNAIKIYLGLVDGVKLPIKTLVEYDPHVWRYLGASILYALIVIAGFILFIVPGIIWSIKYSYFAYGMIDKNLKIKESLRYSADITKGRKWKILGFSFVIIGINILGALALLVGLLVTIPLTMLAYAYVYKKLTLVTDQLIVPSATTSIAQ